jgi:hypothetical protein
MTWIPVKERLPEDGRVVLSYSVCGEFHVTAWFRDQWLWSGQEMTHWRELPERPKKESDEK